MVPEKGLSYLLYAMPSILSKIPKMELVLIGDGPIKSQLIQIIIKLKIKENVKFLGSLDRQELADFLPQSCVFVFPSLREGMPLALLEAVSCGLPIVASNIPGISDIITDGVNGYLVPSKNPKMLSSNILKLLYEEKLRDALGTNSRQTALEKFSLDVAMLRVSNLYSELSSIKYHS
jgi:glycosyltransferase involved in cell wall biosynthesis